MTVFKSSLQSFPLPIGLSYSIGQDFHKMLSERGTLALNFKNTELKCLILVN
jgi:hypothetical protein